MGERNYREEIRLTITEICDNWGFKEPYTLPSAGIMIAEYVNLDAAIEMFEGAYKEVQNDIFKSSAYKATLESILYPLKHKL